MKSVYKTRNHMKLTLTRLQKRKEQLTQKRAKLDKKIKALTFRINKLKGKIYPCPPCQHTSKFIEEAKKHNLTPYMLSNNFIPFYVVRIINDSTKAYQIYNIYGLLDDKFTVFQLSNIDDDSEDKKEDVEKISSLILHYSKYTYIYTNIAILSKILGINSIEKTRQSILVARKAPKLPISYAQFTDICNIIKKHLKVTNAYTKDIILNKLPELQRYINEFLT